MVLRRRYGALSLAALIATGPACFGPELSGVACEGGICPAGFVCDTDTHRCVEPAASTNFDDIEPLDFGDLDLTDPTGTDDGLEMYFARNDPDGNDDIYVSRRDSIDEPWPVSDEIVGDLSMDEIGTPEVSRDGLAMVFTRDNVDGDEEIYTATRPDRDSDFTELGPVDELTGPGDAAHLSTNADGTVGVFDSNRDSDTNDRRLFEVRRANANAPWGEPALIESLAIGGTQRGPTLSPDGLTVYYDQRGDGVREIYRARRSSLDAPFLGEPVRELNDGDRNFDVWVSGDERTVYWISGRDGDDRIYTASR